MYEKGKILGAIELLVAVLAYGVWTAPIRYCCGDGYWYPWFLATNVMAILFLVLPLLGLWAMYRKMAWGYLAIAAFPILAFLFGVTSIPFANYLYGPDSNANTVVIGIVNLMVCLSALWLFKKARENGSNK